MSSQLQEKPSPDVTTSDRVRPIFGFWMALMLAVVAVMVGRGFLSWKKDTGSVTPPAKLAAEIPEAKFTEITRAAGVQFAHQNAAFGEKLLPETMGGGVAFFDFDNDGDQDLLLVNSIWWPWVGIDGKPPNALALYRNDGTGHFADVTIGSGLETALYGMGVAVGDYDNDGLPDIFITALAENRLFHNEGNGKFMDITTAPGHIPPFPPPRERDFCRASNSLEHWRGVDRL